MQKQFLFFLLACSLFYFPSCEHETGSNIVIDFADTIAESPEMGPGNPRPVYIAIASMTSPRETFIYYNQLIDYLSNKLGQTILIKQKKTYEEVNQLLKNGEVDFAFVCSGAYSELSLNNEVNLLVAPVINGKTYYQAYIIAKKEPQFVSFDDLKDKSFAFTDPLSHTGHMYPRYLLKSMSTHERIYFSKTLYTYGHDISIQMVNRGAIDGASVHGLIFDYIAEVHPEWVENVKILKKSKWFAMPPVVTPKQLSKEKSDLYRDLFLNIHKDSLGAAILHNLKIEKFLVVEDSIYENVRKLKDDVEDENI